MTFYDIISQLCIEKGVSMRKMSADNGLSGAITAKWRNNGKPSAKTVKILADYFGKTPQGLLSIMDSETPITTKDTLDADGQLRKLERDNERLWALVQSQQKTIENMSMDSGKKSIGKRPPMADSKITINN